MQELKIIIENYLVYIILIFGVIFLALITTLIFFYLRLKKTPYDIFDEKEAENLEDILIYQSKTLKSLDKDIQELYKISNTINSVSLKGIHKIGLIRFNPFKDVGGDQSFSLALLNGKDDGLVITSLYTREGTRVYAKSIINGVSEKHKLSQEEEKAIKMARKKS